MSLGDFDSAHKLLAESLSRARAAEISEAGGLINLENFRVRCFALIGQAEAALQIAQERYNRVPESTDTGICLDDHPIGHSEFELAQKLLDAITATDQENSDAGRTGISPVRASRSHRMRSGGHRTRPDASGGTSGVARRPVDGD